MGDAVTAKRAICDIDCILQLLGTTCRTPNCPATLSVKTTITGCTLSLQWHCSEGHKGKWSSSRRCYSSNGYPFFVNNLLMCGAILMSGNYFNKIALFCNFFNLLHIKKTTFYQIQRCYLCPVVEQFWVDERESSLRDMGNRPLVVCGDGRNDSPGHSAKYCLYSLMDTESNKLVDVQIIDKREADLKSPRMEKIGLQRGLEALANRVSVVELVTDASTSITAMMG